MEAMHRKRGQGVDKGRWKIPCLYRMRIFYLNSPKEVM
jgi:hypothetical protein